MLFVEFVEDIPTDIIIRDIKIATEIYVSKYHEYFISRFHTSRKDRRRMQTTPLPQPPTDIIAFHFHCDKRLPSATSARVHNNRLTSRREQPYLTVILQNELHHYGTRDAAVRIV